MPQIPADYRALEGSQRTPRTGAKRTGSANPNEILTVSVRIPASFRWACASGPTPPRRISSPGKALSLP